jgi:hypothetical protein
MRSTLPRFVGVVLTGLGLVALVGCGPSEPGIPTPLPSGSSGSTDTSTPTPTSSPTPTVPAGFATTPVVVPSAGTPTHRGLLTDVFVTSVAGNDQVTWRFLGGPAKCRVRYVRPPIVGDASGQPIAVNGQAFLEVRCSPASGYDMTKPTAPATYHGPNRVTGESSNVTEVVKTGDFEAVLHWVIGLQQRVPFTASSSTSAGRTTLVVTVLPVS